jgi:integrase/recombinase XerD
MSRPSRVGVRGPLEPFAVGFRRELARQGYASQSASYQLQLMAHASRWLASRGLGVGDLTPGRVEEFLRARRAEGYTLWLSTKAMAPVLAYLRDVGVVPDAEALGPATPAEELVERYRVYLVQERGLATATVTSYLHVAGLFFSTRSPEGELDLDHLSAGEVTNFVLAECATRKVGSAQYIVCGLRSLLRFLFVSGHVATQLDAAVPKVTGWRLVGLPQSFGHREVTALLASCDRRSTFGRRDLAVLTLLIRLGLRAAEVAALELDDIDWRVGELTIHGKGRRQERMPLPVDVGEAVVGWLRRGRPNCDCVNVFTRVRAPHCGLTSRGVSAIVQAACARAGLPELNAHRLRHSAATEMLRAGAGLIEVGQVLRHTTMLTTSIYAKVDRDRLSTLALPWPGCAS